MLTLRRLQEEVGPWSASNFPGLTASDNLIGVAEELGELAHAHLKHHQGRMTDEEYSEQAQDAIGDILVFLAGYCNSADFDLEALTEKVWSEVKRRDYTSGKKVVGPCSRCEGTERVPKVQDRDLRSGYSASGRQLTKPCPECQ
ncbi:hypothetical protein LCGC14_1830410 [marine sediment metagenome]|uniref:NTP pyrophosphohydrolase MazG putative catalytic core domain-containing protein n=1 Tax=marine sediment metagenome TaxID=412755 RepID=A0A0F9H4F0_9ZZZZ